VRALLAESSPSWLLIDAGPSPVLDVTGAEALDTLRGELAGRGIVLAIARPHGLFRTILDLSGVSERIGSERLFPTCARVSTRSSTSTAWPTDRGRIGTGALEIVLSAK
jgi:MFS superfamily sulfate permease-like transporter